MTRARSSLSSRVLPSARSVETPHSVLREPRSTAPALLLGAALPGARAQTSRLVKDIRTGLYPRTAGSDPFPRGRPEVVLLPRDNGTTGNEPRFSDGTVAGTRMVFDLAPANNSSRPQMFGDGWLPRFAVSNGEIFYTADDGVHGQELWALNLGGITRSIGRSCGDATIQGTDSSSARRPRSRDAPGSRPRSTSCS